MGKREGYSLFSFILLVEGIVGIVKFCSFIATYYDYTNFLDSRMLIMLPRFLVDIIIVVDAVIEAVDKYIKDRDSEYDYLYLYEMVPWFTACALIVFGVVTLGIFAYLAYDGYLLSDEVNWVDFLYIPMALAALIFGGIVTYKKYKLYKKNKESAGVVW